MDIVLVIIGFVLSMGAIIGSILPALPGPLLTFIAFILLQLTSAKPFGRGFFIARAIVLIIITVLDYVIPIIGTKKFWGTKAGVRGSTIGLIVAVVILPILWITLGPFWLIGLVAGPFIGAYLWEQRWGSKHKHALKSAMGSFLWFAAWTLIKIIVSIIMLIYFIGAAVTIVMK